MLKNRIITIFILLAIASSTMFTQCPKDYPYVPYEHWFKATASFTPYQLTYKVGDTIWINVNLPGKQLYDTITKKTIFYDSATFNSFASVQLLYNNPFITDGPFASFVFPENVVASTSNYNGYTAANVSFGCSPSPDYSLKLGIVLIKKGAFNIVFANSSMNNCFTGYAGHANATFVFDVPDTHLSFYQQLPLDSVGLTQNNDVISNLQKKSGIAINVEE